MANVSGTFIALAFYLVPLCAMLGAYGSRVECISERIDDIH
jgi:hypothetical protein